MRKVAWRILIPLLVGILLFIVAAFLGGFAGGACHCDSPELVFFPYSRILENAFSLVTLGGIVIFAQYPLYAITIANVRDDAWRWFTVMILLVLHVAASIVAIKFYNHHR
jgi:hypothetical protein